MFSVSFATQMEGDAVEAVMADAEQLAGMLQPMYKELQVSSTAFLDVITYTKESTAHSRSQQEALSLGATHAALGAPLWWCARNTRPAVVSVLVVLPACTPEVNDQHPTLLPCPCDCLLTAGAGQIPCACQQPASRPPSAAHSCHCESQQQGQQQHQRKQHVGSSNMLIP